MRALADVVVVGAGTIRAEGYGRLRTRDPDGGVVLVDDGERRARHIPAVSADGNYEAARKFGFTGAEVSVESDNGTGFAFFGNGGRHGVRISR